MQLSASQASSQHQMALHIRTWMPQTCPRAHELRATEHRHGALGALLRSLRRLRGALHATVGLQRLAAASNGTA
eukprot:7407884-Alexandrium_andersonii.AAC.1